MPENTTPDDATELDANADAGNTDSGAVDLSTLPESVQNYIKELRDEAASNRVKSKELANTLAKQQEAQQEAAQRQLAEQGKYKELAEQREKQLTELSPYRERAETLERMLRESNEARIAQIPEDLKTLVPTDYAPEKLAGWLDANLSRLTKPVAPPTGAGQQGGGSAIEVTDNDRAAAQAATASGHPITPEQVAARRIARGR